MCNKIIFPILLFISFNIKISARQIPVIRGIVKNARTMEPLSYAHLSLGNGLLGTITNENGEFILNIPDPYIHDTLRVSFIGYISRNIPVDELIENNYQIILLQEHGLIMNTVIIIPFNVSDTITEVTKHILRIAI